MLMRNKQILINRKKKYAESGKILFYFKGKAFLK